MRQPDVVTQVGQLWIGREVAAGRGHVRGDADVLQRLLRVPGRALGRPRGDGGVQLVEVGEPAGQVAQPGYGQVGAVHRAVQGGPRRVVPHGDGDVAVLVVLGHAGVDPVRGHPRVPVAAAAGHQAVRWWAAAAADRNQTPALDLADVDVAAAAGPAPVVEGGEQGDQRHTGGRGSRCRGRTAQKRGQLRPPVRCMYPASEAPMLP